MSSRRDVRRPLSLLGIVVGGVLLAVSLLFSQSRGPGGCDPLNLAKLSPGALDGNCGWSTIQPSSGALVGADYFEVVDGEIEMKGDRYRVNRWAWVPIPPQDDVFSIKIRVRVDNMKSKMPPNFSLSVDDSANYSKNGHPWPFFQSIGAMLYLRGSQGKIMGRDGDGLGDGTFEAENLVPFLGNATYTMTATLDPKGGTYDMEASVDGGPPVVVADHYRFRRDPVAGTFNSLCLWLAGLDDDAEPVQVTVEHISVERD